MRLPKKGDFLIRNELKQDWTILKVVVDDINEELNHIWRPEAKIEVEGGCKTPSGWNQDLFWTSSTYTYHFLLEEEVLIYKMST
jgi:hypothetical protein